MKRRTEVLGVWAEYYYLESTPYRQCNPNRNTNKFLKIKCFGFYLKTKCERIIRLKLDIQQVLIKCSLPSSCCLAKF